MNRTEKSTSTTLTFYAILFFETLPEPIFCCWCNCCYCCYDAALAYHVDGVPVEIQAVAVAVLVVAADAVAVVTDDAIEETDIGK